MSIISSIKSGLSKFGRALSGGLGQFFGAWGTLFYGIFGIFDFGLGYIFGFRPRKKMRLKVVILREVDSDDVRERAMANIDLAKTIFKREVNVVLTPVDGEFIRVMGYDAPEAAVHPGCKNGEAYWEDLGEVGYFYRMESAVVFISSQIGYGSPLTAFIVGTVGGGGRGCSLGPLTSYVTVALKGLSPPGPPGITGPGKTLAHELGHACGLNRTYGPHNLMTKSSEAPPETWTGSTLTSFQKDRFRLSRHVTYF